MQEVIGMTENEYARTLLTLAVWLTLWKLELLLRSQHQVNYHQISLSTFPRGAKDAEVERERPFPESHSCPKKGYSTLHCLRVSTWRHFGQRLQIMTLFLIV